MMTYFEDMLRMIDASIHSMDEEVFKKLVEECVQTIRNGHKVIASGLGKNVPICDKFVGTMLSLGLDAGFLHTNSAVHGDMGMVKEGDLVIILTKSGETSESVYLTKLLKERNANLWLLSFEEESTLANEIPKHLLLKLEHEGDDWNIVPNNSTTLNLIVLQGVAIQTARALGVKLPDFKRNHPGGHIGVVLEDC